MRKVFDRQTYVRAIGEKEWHRTSIFKHLSYQEEKEITVKIIQYDNFKDTLRYVETDEIYNAEIDYTLFRNKPYINIYHAPKYSLMVLSGTPFLYVIFIFLIGKINIWKQGFR